MDGPSPRSLILDLLSTLRKGSMPVGALIEAGAHFGLAGGTLRVALARLLSAGRVERDARGRYRLGEKAAPMRSAIAGWRELDAQTTRWDGSFLAVHTPALPPRSERPRHERALRLVGFRELSPGLALRPANLRGGCEAVRERLASLGLAGHGAVFSARDLDADTDARARSLWDVDALRRGYRASLDTIRASEARLPGLPTDEAMRESFLLGGRVIQQLVLDPLLPEEILDGTDRRALVEAMRRYDRLGRACWAELLARFDVPHLQTPAHTGLADGVGRLDAA